MCSACAESGLYSEAVLVDGFEMLFVILLRKPKQHSGLYGLHVFGFPNFLRTKISTCLSLLFRSATRFLLKPKRRSGFGGLHVLGLPKFRIPKKNIFFGSSNPQFLEHGCFSCFCTSSDSTSKTRPNSTGKWILSFVV